MSDLNEDYNAYLRRVIDLWTSELGLVDGRVGIRIPEIGNIPDPGVAFCLEAWARKREEVLEAFCTMVEAPNRQNKDDVLLERNEFCQWWESARMHPLHWIYGLDQDDPLKAWRIDFFLGYPEPHEPTSAAEWISISRQGHYHKGMDERMRRAFDFLDDRMREAYELLNNQKKEPVTRREVKAIWRKLWHPNASALGLADLSVFKDCLNINDVDQTT